MALQALAEGRVLASFGVEARLGEGVGGGVRGKGDVRGTRSRQW